MSLFVTITHTDFAKATDYSDPEGCPLYQALTRMFPTKEIIVAVIFASILNEDGSKQNYRIPQSWGLNSPYTPEYIDDLIKDAKAMRQIPFVELILVKTSTPSLFL